MKYAIRLPKYEQRMTIGKYVLVENKTEELKGKVVLIKEKTFTIETENRKRVWKPYSKLLKILNEETMNLDNEELENFCYNSDFDYWNYNLKFWHLSILIEHNPNFKYWEYILTNEYLSRLCRYRKDFKYWDYYLVKDNVRMLGIHRSDFDLSLVKVNTKAEIIDIARRIHE